ncbi:MAG: sigma-70 family RNA polymerase sigma factor [Verrucomicrobia bacterium]|nr:sigma-70 family RNA polymerase sigma factor [Verrucomicrobiota bacterium]
MDFHTTSWTVVFEAADTRGGRAQEALADLLRGYWRPLYLLARMRGCPHHDAQDAVQGFFLHFVERRAVKRADPALGRFRAFLQVAFKNFLAGEFARQQAQKRGGGAAHLPIDDTALADLEQALAAAPDPAVAFDRAWALAVLDRATERLRAGAEERGEAEVQRVLARFLERHGTDASQAAAAAELGLTPGAFRVRLHRLRAEFRRLLREEVAATVTDPHELDAELAHLQRALAAGG